MDALTHSEVFFFVSSIGFIVLGTFVGIFLFYLIRAMRVFSRIILKLENSVETIGEATEEIIEDVQGSVIYGFLFGKKRSKRKIKK